VYFKSKSPELTEFIGANRVLTHLLKYCLPEQQEMLIKTVDLKKLVNNKADFKTLKGNIQSEAALDYVYNTLSTLVASFKVPKAALSNKSLTFERQNLLNEISEEERPSHNNIDIYHGNGLFSLQVENKGLNIKDHEVEQKTL